MTISFAKTAALMRLDPAAKTQTRRIWQPRTVRNWQTAWYERPEQVHVGLDKDARAGGKPFCHFVLTARPTIRLLSYTVGTRYGPAKPSGELLVLHPDLAAA